MPCRFGLINKIMQYTEKLDRYIVRNTEKKVYTFMFDNGAESGVVAFEPTKGHKKIIFATNILVQNHDLTNMQKSIISKTVKKSRPQGKMCTRKNGKEIYLIYTVKLPDIFGFRHKEQCYEMLINHGCDVLSSIAQYTNSICGKDEENE